jgi:DNA-binding MarR family transcriptional regulator
MKQEYTDSIGLVERLHRLFLDVIKTELDRLYVEDINNVQALILYNISSDQLTVGELTNRGYYLGSNVSYNVKKLVENEYLLQERSPHDKRSTRVKLSTKGLELCEKIDVMYQRQVDLLAGEGVEVSSISALNQTLIQLERFWTDYVSNRFRI